MVSESRTILAISGPGSVCGPAIFALGRAACRVTRGVWCVGSPPHRRTASRPSTRAWENRLPAVAGGTPALPLLAGDRKTVSLSRPPLRRQLLATGECADTDHECGGTGLGEPNSRPASCARARSAVGEMKSAGEIHLGSGRRLLSADLFRNFPFSSPFLAGGRRTVSLSLLFLCFPFLAGGRRTVSLSLLSAAEAPARSRRRDACTPLRPSRPSKRSRARIPVVHAPRATKYAVRSTQYAVTDGCPSHTPSACPL